MEVEKPVWTGSLLCCLLGSLRLLARVGLLPIQKPEGGKEAPQEGTRERRGVGREVVGGWRAED